MTNFAYLLAALALTACSRSTPPPAAPAPAPVVQPAPPAPPPPTIHRLDAGGWPGSNTHQWGSRHYELRTEAGQLEVRIHDEIDFQGVGMQPQDMPPTNHRCTPWEPAPAPIALPTTPPTRGHISCGAESALCAAIESHFKSTQKAGDDWNHTFGRGGAEC